MTKPIKVDELHHLKVIHQKLIKGRRRIDFITRRSKALRDASFKEEVLGLPFGVKRHVAIHQQVLVGPIPTLKGGRRVWKLKPPNGLH